MKNRLLLGAAIVAVGLALSPARAETAIAVAHPSVSLELGVGSTVMLGRPFKSVLIGDPDVVDVQTQDDRSVLLKPLGLGTTNLIFIDDQGIVITNLTVQVRRQGRSELAWPRHEAHGFAARLLDPQHDHVHRFHLGNPEPPGFG